MTAICLIKEGYDEDGDGDSDNGMVHVVRVERRQLRIFYIIIVIIYGKGGLW